MTIHLQYATIQGGWLGAGGIISEIWAALTHPLHTHRNYTSSGPHWYGLYRPTGRINIWPLSIWI